jgi:recombination protein RecA
MKMPDDKKKNAALQLAIQSIQKAFGKGAIMRLKERDSLVERIPSVPTGSLALDCKLGIGGYPRGRVVEIYGPEASGKTTLALHAIANVQKQGGVAAFIDAEHALDTTYARRLGVNTEELLISQPDYGEQALEIADMLIRSGAIDLVIIDSVAALVPKAELEGEMGDTHVGLQARLMSQALRKLTGSLGKSNCTMMFINQLRMKIGVMFGSPETTSGGNALKFYASVRLRIGRIGQVKEAGGPGRDPAVIGNRTRVKITKNKMAPPFREVEFDIIYGKGICRPGEILDMAVDDGIIDKSGSWFSYGEQRIGQGREKVRNFLDTNPDLLNEIENKVRAKHGLDPVVGTSGAGTSGAGTSGAGTSGVSSEKGPTTSDQKDEAVTAAPTAKARRALAS